MNATFHWRKRSNVRRDADRGRRKFIISQDRHEIFIIVGEFTSAYVDDIAGDLACRIPPEFLIMHEYGPWDITNKKQMHDVGYFLFAISMELNHRVQM